MVSAVLTRVFDRMTRWARRPARPIAPRRIRLEASSFCQLRCPSCPTASGRIKPAIGSGFLRFENFRKLLDSTPGIEAIELSNYGEAFLNPELLRILEYAHRMGVGISVANGANLNSAKEEILEGLVRYGVQFLNCSIDGATDETYRQYRVRGKFDRVIRNIERINFHKRHYQSDLPRLKWQFIVFGHNEHEIPLARAKAEQLGMEFVLKLSWDETFSPVRDRPFVQAQSGWQALTRAEYERANGKKYLSEICHQLWDQPQINWDGKVLGCCRNFWGDFGGNAFVDGLTNSINNEGMDYARAMLRGQKPPRADIPCSTCGMYIGMRQAGKFIVRD